MSAVYTIIFSGNRTARRGLMTTDNLALSAVFVIIEK
jgi:hypothetical protein